MLIITHSSRTSLDTKFGPSLQSISCVWFTSILHFDCFPGPGAQAMNQLNGTCPALTSKGCGLIAVFGASGFGGRETWAGKIIRPNRRGTCQCNVGPRECTYTINRRYEQILIVQPMENGLRFGGPSCHLRGCVCAGQWKWGILEGAHPSNSFN